MFIWPGEEKAKRFLKRQLLKRQEIILQYRNIYDSETSIVKLVIKVLVH